jgi:hypothetical protein
MEGSNQVLYAHTSVTTKFHSPRKKWKYKHGDKTGPIYLEEKKAMHGFN